MLTIYHSPLSRSVRVLWLAEELGLDYQIAQLTLFSDAMQQPDYLAVHPLGKVPAINDDGFVLWETTAIFDYLVSKYSDGALIPPRDTAAGAKVVQWINFAENPLTIIVGEMVAHNGVLPPERCIPALVERGQEMLPDLVAVVESELAQQFEAGSEFIVGNSFTAADIMLCFGLMIAQYLGCVNETTPHTQAYCQRLLARDAYLRASQK